MKAVHLTNQDLRAAHNSGIESLSGELQRHLSACDECTLALAFLRAFPVAGQLPLVDAPSYVIAKAVQIPTEKKKSSVLRRLVEAATLLFDSWATPVPAGVRSGSRVSRRLRYSAPHCQLDLQTVRVQQGWDCTARIVAERTGSPDSLAIRVGRQRYLVDQSGFVSWQSVRPPKSVTVLNGTAVMMQAEVVWSDRSLR